MSKYKYTEEMVAKLQADLASGATPEKIASLAAEFEFPTRSISAKARKLGIEVPTAEHGPVFSQDETEAFRNFVTSRSAQLTAEEIGKEFAGGKFTTKQISGKALALELTSHIKPAEKKAVVRLYTAGEEGKIASMVAAGKCLEEIADALGKPIPSVRGKLLSMELKAPQRDKKEKKAGAYEGIEKCAASMTVAELAVKFEKTERGVKTVLTRKGLAAKDYTPKSKE